MTGHPTLDTALGLALLAALLALTGLVAALTWDVLQRKR